jgi:hypothetical protein
MENVRKIFRNAVSGLCSKGTELKREPRILSLVTILRNMDVALKKAKVLTTLRQKSTYPAVICWHGRSARPVT